MTPWAKRWLMKLAILFAAILACDLLIGRYNWPGWPGLMLAAGYMIRGLLDWIFGYDGWSAQRERR